MRVARYRISLSSLTGVSIGLVIGKIEEVLKVLGGFFREVWQK